MGTCIRFLGLGIFLYPLVTFSATPDDDDTEYEFQYDESLDKKWEEAATDIPSYPKQQDLVPVPPSNAYTIKLFIDENSISVGDDRVVRLTYIVESASGVRNVFFEGFYCTAKQYKTYAFGTADGSLQAVKNAKWRDIPDIVTNAFRMELYKDYLCTDFAPMTRREILQHVKYPHPEYE